MDFLKIALDLSFFGNITSKNEGFYLKGTIVDPEIRRISKSLVYGFHLVLFSAIVLGIQNCNLIYFFCLFGI